VTGAWSIANLLWFAPTQKLAGARNTALGRS
jgi:hypothetical protein